MVLLSNSPSLISFSLSTEIRAFSPHFIISVSCGFLSLFNLLSPFPVCKLSCHIWLSLGVYSMLGVKAEGLIGISG